ncbi:MAG: RNA methyltransferase [Lachnospiraceae bacterium]|nr:RNA methyltransferase [Lachnospiraceae bacterium]
MAELIPVTSLEDPRLQIYTSLNEPQLRHYYEPEPGVFIAESANVIHRALDAGFEPLSMVTENRFVPGADFGFPTDGGGGNDATVSAVRAVARLMAYDIPIYTAELPVLRKLTSYALTHGILCVMRRKPLPSAEEICAGLRRIAVLESVLNPTNIGAVFRSAAALGVEALLLTRGSGDPLQRRAIRVSMGTVFQIPWTWLADEDGADYIPPADEDGNKGRRPANIVALHRMGFKAAAMALTDKAVDVDDPVLRGEDRLAVLLGSESTGLRAVTVRDSDYAVKIPMQNGVDSLNVAAASAVAFWALLR